MNYQLLKKSLRKDMEDIREIMMNNKDHNSLTEIKITIDRISKEVIDLIDLNLSLKIKLKTEDMKEVHREVIPEMIIEIILMRKIFKDYLLVISVILLMLIN